eukprot:3950677-Prorocentrum_lima.AAC.1
MASPDLFAAQVDPYVTDKLVVATHKAVVFSIKAPMEWPRVCTISRGPSLPLARPIGPVPQPPCWDAAAAA